jgi:phospholipid/cholesterol/gamma-HCH transport system ATP-binding protein
MTSAPKLQARAVRKAFSGRQVLDGVDIRLDAGRSLVVIGASGAGKSVLLKCALGLMTPDSGTIQIDGESLADLPARARKSALAGIGMVFQGAALFDSAPLWENIAFRLLHVDGVSHAEARRRALETMAQVHLPADAADRSPAALSGGMQKRAGLARALITRPSLLLLDEPTTGLDPVTGAAINALIRTTVTDLGCAALTITHDMASAKTVGDDIAMLHRGRIIWTGPAASIDTADDARVRQFVRGQAEGPLNET